MVNLTPEWQPPRDSRRFWSCVIFNFHADSGPLWSQGPFIHLTMHFTVINHFLWLRQLAEDAQATVMNSRGWRRWMRSKNTHSVTSGSGQSYRNSEAQGGGGGRSCHSELGTQGLRVFLWESENLADTSAVRRGCWGQIHAKNSRERSFKWRAGHVWETAHISIH